MSLGGSGCGGRARTLRVKNRDDDQFGIDTTQEVVDHMLRCKHIEHGYMHNMNRV